MIFYKIKMKNLNKKLPEAEMKLRLAIEYIERSQR